MNSDYGCGIVAMNVKKFGIIFASSRLTCRFQKVAEPEEYANLKRKWYADQ